MSFEFGQLRYYPGQQGIDDYDGQYLSNKIIPETEGHGGGGIRYFPCTRAEVVQLVPPSCVQQSALMSEKGAYSWPAGVQGSSHEVEQDFVRTLQQSM